MHSMIKTWISTGLPFFFSMNVFTKVWQIKHVQLLILQNKINFSFSKSCIIPPPIFYEANTGFCVLLLLVKLITKTSILREFPVGLCLKPLITIQLRVRAGITYTTYVYVLLISVKQNNTSASAVDKAVTVTG